MKLIDRLFGGRLSPRWEISPGATLWKLEVTECGRLVGEARDLDAKRMSLFSIDLESGRLLFSERSLDEPWWVALDSVVGEIAIVHRFPKPDMPNVLGASAVHAATGELLWSDETLRVVCGTREILLAQRGASSDAPRLVFVDALTGQTLDEADEERAMAFESTCDDSERWSGWQSAEELDEGSLLFAAHSQIIARELADRRGPIEAAKYGRFTILSAYIRSRRDADAMLQGLLDNVLLVIDEGRIAFRETIAAGLPAPTSDSFFVRRGVLYFVRQGRTLVALSLEE